MTERPRRLPEPFFKKHPGVEVDDTSECPKAPAGWHLYLWDSSATTSELSCVYCRREADPAPPDPMDKWRGVGHA